MTNAQKMINQIAEYIPLSNQIKSILLSVDRELFSPSYAKHFSYTLDAINIGNGRWLQAPLTVSKIVQYLELKRSDKVLEVGCGSGYQTAILSKMCRHVHTMECDAVILNKAQKIFKTLKINNVYPILTLEEKDWKPKEIFDRIVFSLSVEEVPNIYFYNLAENGIIIAPLEVRDNYQILTKYHKKNGIITIENIEQCLFASMSDIIKKCDIQLKSKSYPFYGRNGWMKNVYIFFDKIYRYYSNTVISTREINDKI